MSTATLGQAPAFGRYMKQWRRQRGLSQLDLAVRADVSQRHVSFIETGRSRPKEDVVHKVAEALGGPASRPEHLAGGSGLGAQLSGGTAVGWGRRAFPWRDSADAGVT